MIGSSFGAAIAVYVCGVDKRVAAAISSGGWGDGERKFRGQHPTPEAWKKFTDMLAEGKRHREKTGKSLMVPRYDIVPIPEHLRGHLAQNSIQMFTAETAQSMYDFRADDVIGKAARPADPAAAFVGRFGDADRAVDRDVQARRPAVRPAPVRRDRPLHVRGEQHARAQRHLRLAGQVFPGPGARGGGVDRDVRCTTDFPSPPCSRSRATRWWPAACPRPTPTIAAKQMIEADLTGFDAHGIFRLRAVLQDAADRARQAQGQHQGAAALAGDRAGRRRRRHRPSGDDLLRQSGDRAGRASPASAGSARATPITPAPPASTPRCRSAHGMVGIYAAVSTINNMAPWGGAEALLGTNPIAIGIPAGKEAPVVLDIATSVVSFGNIRQLRRRRQADARRLGGPQQDRRADHRSEKGRRGRAAADRRPQGRGLALIIGLLAGVLNGAAFGRDVVDFMGPGTEPTNTGQFVIALDVARFIAPEMFAAEMDRHLGELRSSPTLPGVDAIRIPGEERRRRRLERSANGVQLSRDRWSSSSTSWRASLKIAAAGASAERSD